MQCFWSRFGRAVFSHHGHPRLSAPTRPNTLDPRQPMALAAQAIARRLDPTQDYRPWFRIRGTFQCWGAANDLIGHDDIEGCVARAGAFKLWPWHGTQEPNGIS